MIKLSHLNGPISITDTAVLYTSVIAYAQIEILRSTFTFGGTQGFNVQRATISTSTFIGPTSSGVALTLSGMSSVTNSTFINHTRAIAIQTGEPGTVITGNNFYDISSYVLVNSGPHNIDGRGNYWGVTTEAEVGTKIYDFFDNVFNGQVDTTNTSYQPLTNPPIKPPTQIRSNFGSPDLQVQWTASPESDIVGYRVYYDSDTLYPYANVVDVGNVTNVTLPGLGATGRLIAVTAYDASAGADDWRSGHESWFSDEVANLPTTLTRYSATVGRRPFSVAVDLRIPSGHVPWTATSDSSWATISPASGIGSTLAVTIAYASFGGGAVRRANITIAGLTFALTQVGSDTFGLEPTSASVGPDAGTGSVGIVAVGPYPWTAYGFNSPSWVTVSPSSGTGNGTVTYTYQANPLPTPRTAELIIGGQSFFLTQARSNYDVTPTAITVPANSGTATITVTTATPTTTWTAVANDPWLTVDVVNNTGSRELTFTFDGRGATVQNRVGTLTIAGRTVTVTQLGVTPVFTVTPAAIDVGPAAMSGVLEAGSGPMRSDVASVPTGTTLRTFSYDGVPTGVYYLRVRGINPSGVSAPSNEIVITVGGVQGPPAAPQNFAAAVAGTTVTFTWQANNTSDGTTNYVLEAGRLSQSTDIAVFATPGLTTSLQFSGIPPGTYHVRLRAQNAIGVGGTSNELRIVVSP